MLDITLALILGTLAMWEAIILYKGTMALKNKPSKKPQ